ncbi:glucosamine-6-phosphate deaminase [Porticoccus sp. GXU_MW_L64]
MEVIILNNSDAVAELGARRICELVTKKPDAVLGLATGSTPIAMYQQLIALYQQGKVSFEQVSSFNLDEYIGISPENPQSYRSFMKEQLFDAVNIDQTRTRLPTCDSHQNPRKVGAEYEQSIADAGGIDLQILGIGSNGHIGFNEPTSSFASRTRVKTLTQSTVQDNSRLFAEGEFQPHLAMTMGIGTILNSRRVILLATGEAKAGAVQQAVEGPLSAMCPASALQLHERATFIIDRAAASQLQHMDYYQWVHSENEPLVEQYGNFYEL